MITKKHILSLITVFVLGLTPVVATVPAYAATNTTTNQTNFFTGLVQFLAQTFHLDQTQVQNAVNTYTTQKKATMQQNMQDREKKYLDSLVTQVKITSSQEQQILEEQAKLRSEYNPANFKNMTADQRKQEFQKERAEIKAWSQSTGIDTKYLSPGFGMRMHMFNKWNNNTAPTSVPTQ